jgi:hypothetical protein
MKNTLLLCLLAALVSGCASLEEPAVDKSKTAENIFDPKFPIYTQLAPGKTGDMAYAVERLAKASGCELQDNASLMTKRPGIQFYRVPCADGHSILYKCEMRQCRVAD